MTQNPSLDERLARLSSELRKEESVVDSVMAGLDRAEAAPVSHFNRRRILTMMLKPQSLIAAAAVIALMFFGLRPPVTDPQSDHGAWWLAPRSAWAGELQAAITEAGTKGFTCHEQFINELRDGVRATSSTTSTLFVARDAYRRDIYEQGRLRESQWYVQGNEGLSMTSVRYDERTYSVTLDPDARRRDADPLGRMREMAQRLDKAGQRLGTNRVDGREAVEFEIAATKLSALSDEATMHVWLDQATKMPLKISYEFDSRAGPQSPVALTILMQDQFDWRPTFPAGTFTPQIPEGFTKVDSE